MHPNKSYQKAIYTQDESILLETLLDAGNDCVPVNVLAQSTGVSPAAIPEQLEKLRTQDFSIETVHNRGYRLKESPNRLHPALIRHHLKKTTTHIDLIHFPTIDSTNSEAERQYATGRKSPFAITASFQTQGRGRLARKWHSASAENLYLSVLFEPKIPPPRIQSFTLWAGIYICRILQAFIPSTPLKIKWPNDLYCDGRKFAGMLTEAKMDSGNLHSIIFGVGINVNSNPLDYPDGLSSSATSLFAIGGRELPLNRLTARVIEAIEQAYKTCTHDKPSESLTEVWATLDALSGKTVTILQGNKEISGIVQGIDTSGALLIMLHDHTIQSICAGEVTFKK